MQVLGATRLSALRANLIIHHGLTDVLDPAVEHIYIIITELVLLCQWDYVPENIIQFSSKSCASDQRLTLESVRLPFEGRPPPLLLDLALGSRHAERLCQSLNSGNQRFYHSMTPHLLLG